MRSKKLVLLGLNSAFLMININACGDVRGGTDEVNSVQQGLQESCIYWGGGDPDGKVKAYCAKFTDKSSCEAEHNDDEAKKLCKTGCTCSWEAT